jgi:RNAse (barnase) inhibitor barstar
LEPTELRILLNISKEAVAVIPTGMLDKNILTSLANESEYKLFHLNGLHIRTKDELLKSLAYSMEFPNYFGHNWDALEECLTDLEWLPAKGYILLFSHPKNFINNSSADFDTFIEIVTSVSKYWAAQQIRFLVIFVTEDEQKNPPNQ